MKLSVVVPARNEEDCIEATVREISAALSGRDFEIVVVNDHSTDRTETILRALTNPALRVVNCESAGFGHAVRCGIATASGDALAIFMADASESAEDLVRFWRVLEEQGVDCVFGSRFRAEGAAEDYPPLKFLFNRAGNFLVAAIFGLRYYDITNSFKFYRREVINSVLPLESAGFELALELPLKAIRLGHSYTVVPSCWRNRRVGKSKFRMVAQLGPYLRVLARVTRMPKRS